MEPDRPDLIDEDNIGAEMPETKRPAKRRQPTRPPTRAEFQAVRQELRDLFRLAADSLNGIRQNRDALAKLQADIDNAKTSLTKPSTT